MLAVNPALEAYPADRANEIHSLSVHCVLVHLAVQHLHKLKSWW
jgi:hypothetical protein